MHPVATWLDHRYRSPCLGLGQNASHSFAVPWDSHGWYHEGHTQCKVGTIHLILNWNTRIYIHIYIYYQNCSVAPGSQRSEFSRASWSNFMRNTTLAMQYAFEFSQFAMQVFRFPINIHLCIFNPQVCNLGQFAAQKIWEFCIFGIATGNKHTKELAESSKLYNINIYIYTVPQEPAQEEQDSMENELEEVVGVGVAVIDMAYLKKENNFHTRFNVEGATTMWHLTKPPLFKICTIIYFAVQIVQLWAQNRFKRYIMHILPFLAGKHFWEEPPGIPKRSRGVAICATRLRVPWWFRWSYGGCTQYHIMLINTLVPMAFNPQST